MSQHEIILTFLNTIFRNKILLQSRLSTFLIISMLLYVFLATCATSDINLTMPVTQLKKSAIALKN